MTTVAATDHRPTKRRHAALVGGLLAATMLHSAALAEDSPAAGASRRTMAVRTGWAYGVGLELEYRPGAWGIGASGGYVPGIGFGGYLGVQWGLRPLATSGWVAEAGVFRGVHNVFRVADTGYGAYAQAGYAFALTPRWSVRTVAGGGFPLDDPDHLGSFEILAKATIGVLF